MQQSCPHSLLIFSALKSPKTIRQSHKLEPENPGCSLIVCSPLSQNCRTFSQRSNERFISVHYDHFKKNRFIAIHFSLVDFTCEWNSEMELKMVRTIPLSWPAG